MYIFIRVSLFLYLCYQLLLLSVWIIGFFVTFIGISFIIFVFVRFEWLLFICGFFLRFGKLNVEFLKFCSFIINVSTIFIWILFLLTTLTQDLILSEPMFYQHYALYQFLHFFTLPYLRVLWTILIQLFTLLFLCNIVSIYSIFDSIDFGFKIKLIWKRLRNF